METTTIIGCLLSTSTIDLSGALAGFCFFPASAGNAATIRVSAATPNHNAELRVALAATGIAFTLHTRCAFNARPRAQSNPAWAEIVPPQPCDSPSRITLGEAIKFGQ